MQGKKPSRPNYRPLTETGCALTPKCVATGRQPPYKIPAETPVAPLPMAIELEPPPSRSIPSLAPRSASSSSISRGEIFSPTAKNKSLRDGSTATAVREWGSVGAGPHAAIPQPYRLSANPPLRSKELGRSRRLGRPQVWCQLLVEPQQIRMFPHVAEDMVGHHGFHAVG